MDKKLQDHVWSILPKEFKEEVKKQFRDGFNDDREAIGRLFGIDNLLSDAEEEEMLTVEKSKVRYRFQYAKEGVEENPDYYNGYAQAIYDLFGSKCQPEEEHPKQKDCDNPLADKEGCKWRNDGKCAFDSACYFEPLNPQEPKPAEPKFKVGDKVRCTLNNKICFLEGRAGKHHYMLSGIDYNVHEDYLEPYTEPTETFTDDCQSQRKSQNHIVQDHEMVDNIIKEGFLKERRCNIAVQMVKAITQSPEIVDRISSTATDSLLDDILSDALYLTDKLIEKCEKGGSK